MTNFGSFSQCPCDRSAIHSSLLVVFTELLITNQHNAAKAAKVHKASAMDARPKPIYMNEQILTCVMLSWSQGTSTDGARNIFRYEIHASNCTET